MRHNGLHSGRRYGTPLIARAHRTRNPRAQLALKLHPDKNRAPKAEEAFKAVSRAFSCLSDADKRAHYDRWAPPRNTLRRGAAPTARAELLAPRMRAAGCGERGRRAVLRLRTLGHS